jgi:hypothetical protein
MNALNSVQWLVTVLTGLVAYIAVNATMLMVVLISKSNWNCKHLKLMQRTGKHGLASNIAAGARRLFQRC